MLACYVFPKVACIHGVRRVKPISLNHAMMPTEIKLEDWAYYLKKSDLDGLVTASDEADSAFGWVAQHAISRFLEKE